MAKGGRGEVVRDGGVSGRAVEVESQGRVKRRCVASFRESEVRPLREDWHTVCHESCGTLVERADSGQAGLPHVFRPICDG